MEQNKDEIIEIRPYAPSDLDSLYNICLKTGVSIKEETDIYKDPKLLGHFYAAPYAVLEPELTFIVSLNSQQSGYILGTKDSGTFKQKCEETWFPSLRDKYQIPEVSDNSPDAAMIRLIHQGYNLKKEFANYPAHLHINLLPGMQGKGLGKKIMLTFIEKLKELNVSALHLEVGKKNLGAIGFYKRIGFHQIVEYEYSIGFGMILND